MDLIVYALLKSKLSEATSEISSRMNILEEDINNKMAVLDAGLTPVASKNGDVTKDAMTAEAWERLNDESVDIFASVDGVFIKATYEKNQDDEIVISAGNNILCTISEEGNRFTVDWNSYFTDADVNVVEKGILGVELNLVNGEGAGSLKQVGNNTASGNNSFAEGGNTTASGTVSHAEGGGTIANGSASHAEGGGTTANGANSHSEGSGTFAYGANSHAEGAGTITGSSTVTSSGNNAHAEGGGTTATGHASHAEGSGTTASGQNSHAEGGGTIANGECSHAEGGSTTANGDASHAEGAGTIANRRSQHVFGEWNITDNTGASGSAKGTYVEIVGNGTINARSNARALSWNGNEYLAGDVYVNCDASSANGVKLVSETDYGNMLNAGIVKASGSYGIRIATPDGDLSTFGADLTKIKVGTNAYEPVVPSHQHESAFYGLAKAAGDTTQASSSNAVGTYTDNAKTAIKNMLGVATASDKATYSIVNDAATNIQINGTSATLSDIISKNVGTIEVTQDGSTYIFELVESGTNKVYVCNYANSHAAIIPVANDATSLVPTWYDKYERIYVRYDEGTGAATVLNDSVATVLLNANIPTIVILTFAGDTSEKEYTLQRTEHQPNYGTGIKMVKYSNVDTANTSNETVITICYSDSAIISVAYSVAQGLSDVTVDNVSVVSDGVAAIPRASHDRYGVMRTGGASSGLFYDNGKLCVNYADLTTIKNGTQAANSIPPSLQHASTFYGLAKAAGDTTQSQSSNAVGTYTPEAKTAIQSMLGIQEVLGGSVVEVSESDPVITATPNTQYICGEVATLSFTPYQIGVSDVIFTSGSTPTVLTLPNTVKMPEWFTIEANRVYEINVSNGIYGSVMSWAN